MLLQKESEAAPDDLHHIVIDRDDPDSLEKAGEFAEAFEPDLVVGGGPYGPAWLASELAGDRPLWVDIPGDPFAEAQAKSADLEHLLQQATAREAALKAENETLLAKYMEQLQLRAAAMGGEIEQFEKASDANRQSLEHAATGFDQGMTPAMP